MKQKNKERKKEEIVLEIPKLKCWNCEGVGTIKKCFNVINKDICLTCISCSASSDYNEVVETLIDIAKNTEDIFKKQHLLISKYFQSTIDDKVVFLGKRYSDFIKEYKRLQEWR